MPHAGDGDGAGVPDDHVTALVCLTIMDVVGRRAPFGLHHRGAVVEKSDLAWLALALVIVCLAYFNIWRGGVPKVFGEGDISASWNPWAMICSHGLFPSASGGYPQFIPTLWAAVTAYIFTGSGRTLLRLPFRPASG